MTLQKIKMLPNHQLRRVKKNRLMKLMVKKKLKILTMSMMSQLNKLSCLKEQNWMTKASPKKENITALNVTKVCANFQDTSKKSTWRNLMLLEHWLSPKMSKKKLWNCWLIGKLLYVYLHFYKQKYLPNVRCSLKSLIHLNIWYLMDP